MTGLTLAAIDAAGASGLKAAQLSERADPALAVSVVMVLQPVNLVAVPLSAGQVVTGASISAATILKNRLELVLIPLVIGLFIRGRYVENAATWQPELVNVANLALVIALVAGIAVNWSAIVSLFGSRALLASLAIAAVALALGFSVGMRNPATRATTGLISGLRFASLGLIIIGTQLNGDPAILGPAIVFAPVDMVVSMVVAVEIGRKGSRRRGLMAPSKMTRPWLGPSGAERPTLVRGCRGEADKVRFDAYSFGSIRIDGRSYDHDLIIEHGEIRKRKKAPSKPFRDAYGHTPLSVAEDLPWACRRLVIGTGAAGALPVMDDVKREARKRKVDLVVLPTAEAIEVLQAGIVDTNAVLHVTC